MSYRIERGESLAAAFGRIAGEEIHAALEELRRQDRGTAVHNVRKALKRLRALVRSLRVALPENVFRQENRRLGDAGRKMSPLRDVHVQLRTLRKLRGGSTQAGKSVRQRLLLRQKKMCRGIPTLRRALRAMLHQSQRRIRALPLQNATPREIAAGLKKIYQQGRSRFKAASRRPTPENLHEWRKKVKALGFGFELVEDLVPKKFAKMALRCAELGGLLGDDHDLFMVLEALRLEHAAHPSVDYRALAARIAGKRRKFARRSLKLGALVYADKPRAFEKCLDKLLQHDAQP